MKNKTSSKGKLRPVLVGGCPRSGTTFLGSLLGKHQRCLTIPESHFKIEIIKCYEKGYKLKEIINKVNKNWRFQIWDIPEIDFYEFEKYANNSIESNVIKNLLNFIIISYNKNLDNENNNFDLWIDHTPSNIKFFKRLNDIYNNIKLIHIIRDGRAVSASVMPLDWGPNTIINSAHWWVENISFGLGVKLFLEKDKYLSIKYEDLVRNPEKVLRRICEFLNIEFCHEMIKGDGFKKPNYTSQQHKLIGNKPDVSRINNWKQELTQREIEIFENITADLLSYFNYELQFGKKAKSSTRIERLKMKLKENIRKHTINKIKRNMRRGRFIFFGG